MFLSQGKMVHLTLGSPHDPFLVTLLNGGQLLSDCFANFQTDGFALADETNDIRE
jgi:hypothetical protein